VASLLLLNGREATLQVIEDHFEMLFHRRFLSMKIAA
jgi:hypothetical protein